MSLQPDQVVDGKYRVVKLLGEGGMGAVYEGENVRIKRRVAIKVLHPEIGRQTDLVTRFEREAQAAARIGSKHIVDVLDLGDLEDGSRFLVMEYLDGESLLARIERDGPMNPAGAALIAVQVLDGLKKAHEAGIVHRDMKPDNVFLTKEGENHVVKILDFGISKFGDGAGEAGVTQAGLVMGTPSYMAPEQARGRTVDARADLYSLGVILYECVSGRLPHEAENVNDLMFKIVLEAPTPLAHVAPDVPDDFIALVDKALTRDPDVRYQTAREFQRALEAWLVDHPGEVAAEEFLTETKQSEPRLQTLTEAIPVGRATDAFGVPVDAERVARATIATVAPPRPSRVVPVLGLVAALALAGGAVLFLQRPKSTPTPPAPQAVEVAAAAAPATVPATQVAVGARAETQVAAPSTPRTSEPPTATKTSNVARVNQAVDKPAAKADALPPAPTVAPPAPPPSGRTYRREL